MPCAIPPSRKNRTSSTLIPFPSAYSGVHLNLVSWPSVEKPKVVVVMPAYNAEKTLRMTYAELPRDIVDLVILVDDGSSDETLRIARELKLEVFVHNRNYGYGANQKN